MKKLLLVMLVPVLVLGVMSCGAKIPNGDANPLSLQGKWGPTPNTNVSLIIAGNQITLVSPSTSSGKGNITLRTNYDGDTGTDDDGILTSGQKFTITFNWYEKPYDEIGYIEATANANFTGAGDAFTVNKVVYSAYYQNVMLPAQGTVYTKQ
jgi:hypothetical protein